MQGTWKLRNFAIIEVYTFFKYGGKLMFSTSFSNDRKPYQIKKQ